MKQCSVWCKTTFSTLWRWTSCWHLPKRKHRDYCMRYILFTWYGSVFQPILSLLFFSKPDLCDGSHFFQALDLLKRASVLRGEAQWLEMEGLGKIEAAVSGSEAEGLYEPLRGAISHSLMSYTPSHPKNATTPELPPSLSHPLRSLRELHLKFPLLQLEKLNWHQKSPPQLYHKLWKWLSLLTWHHFPYSWGHQEGL